MPQSFASIYIHLVFSTKNRAPVLTDAVREQLHKYFTAALNSIGCTLIAVNSVEDHVHILFSLSRTVTVGKATEHVKKTSSKWIKTKGAAFANFSWQRGYGAFAVSVSNTGAVCEYIAKQREHHKRISFENEFIGLLKRHKLPYDERYVFD